MDILTDIRPGMFCSYENTCVRVSFLIKLKAFRPATFFKKRLRHGCLPVNFAKFLRAKSFMEQCASAVTDRKNIDNIMLG